MLHTVPNVFSTEGLTSSQEWQRPKRERPNPKPDVEGPLRFGPPVQCSGIAPAMGPRGRPEAAQSRQ